jgi:hypothetical protein
VCENSLVDYLCFSFTFSFAILAVFFSLFSHFSATLSFPLHVILKYLSFHDSSLVNCIFHLKNFNKSHACGLLRIVDKVDSNHKCVVTNAQHPKIKRGCASNIINKSLENIFLLVFVPIFKKTHSLVAINMKIIFVHIDGKLNTSAMDFQWIT